MSDVCLPLILEILVRSGLCWASTDCEFFYPCPIVGNSSETAQCFTKLCILREKVSDIFSSKER